MGSRRPGGSRLGNAGPDAARRGALAVPTGESLLVAVDTLVIGVHFPTHTRPEDLGHKALAVNLSDLAAMAATPLGFSLVLTHPDHQPAWLAAFEEGLGRLADRYRLSRVAARYATGPLCVTVEVYGHAPTGVALLRRGARPGDQIYVTGTLGDAALALEALVGGRPLAAEALVTARARLDRPEPRIAAGLALRGQATAAIDVSDGLAADLGHVLAASGVGAAVEVERLPLSDTLRTAVDEETAWHLALAGGDDYELCFTAPGSDAAEAARLGAALGCPVTCIGRVEETRGLRCVRGDGSPLESPAGYEHFSGEGSGALGVVA